VELFYTANASLAGMTVHLGPTGFLSYLLPLILVVCALLCLFSPAQRLFYGIIALLTALYSFIGLNLGGFFIGMLLGIIGGALVVAWGPPRIRPVNPDFVPIADQVSLEEEASDTTEIKAADAPTEEVEVAGHDDRPAADPETGLVPGFDDDREGPKSGSGRSRFSRNPKALTVALIVMGLTAAMLAVGSKVPASAAADCPKGLPSISASATPSRTTAAADKAAARSASALKKTKKTIAGTSSSKATGAAKATPTATPTASPSKDDDGNPIVDGVKGIIGGVGNLLGVGDDPSSSPSESPSPSGTPTAAPTTLPTGGPAPTGTGSSGPAPSGSSGATPSGSSAATPTPSPSNDDVPCLGPRQRGLKADADGIPLIAGKPGLLEAKSLEMYDATYDGVVNLPTGAGTSVRVLKFSMSRAVNKPFSLTIDEASGAKTVITSNELTTAGHVEFYTEHFQGNLFGVIPLTFTPDQPPPLTLAYMPFTDAVIRLNYVQCDVLTGIPLHISEK
jgi:hypothetical protein